MATRILVPLDGSPLAECALPEAMALATGLAAEVILLEVVPLIDAPNQEEATRVTIEEFLSQQRASALEYLNSVRQRPEWKAMATTVVVETGPPAETILDSCRKHQVDRIVMATHGRTGITRWVYGSVADKVLRAADRTVVLVRSTAPPAPGAHARVG